jgi:hypothetical protein
MLACFVAGSPVTMSTGKTKSIDRVKVGETVRSFDESTKQFVAAQVVDVQHHEAKMETLIEFTLSTGKRFVSNNIHPIMVNAEYMAAGDIAKQFVDGKTMTFTSQSARPVTLKRVKVLHKAVKLFNLHVRSQYDTEGKDSSVGHNYMVQGVVVHNVKAWTPADEINFWANYPNDPTSTSCQSSGGWPTPNTPPQNGYKCYCP